MKARNLGLTLTLLILTAQFGCGDTRSRQNSGARTFEDEKPAAPQPQASAPAPAPAPAPETSETPEQKNDREALKAAPMILRGEVRNAMPAYRVPEKLRERLQETNPELVAPQSKSFEVFNQHLHIKAKDSSMTFTAVLRIPGKQEEPIELKCNFDQSAAPWSCDQMYPVDPRVAAERRLQATVNCLDTHKCERVGVELFVVIDGKTESQLFQNQKFSARRATSGDVEETEDGVKALPKPVPVGPLAPLRPRILEKPTPEKPPVQPAPGPAAPAPEAAPQEAETVPAPVPAAPAPEPEIVPPPELSESELQEAMDDPNSAIEITAPIPMPRPGRGQYSIPGIETLHPETGRGVKTQAIGFHNGGTLRDGTTLPASGPGFVCRKRPNRNYGTEMTIQLLEGAAGAVEKAYPNKSPIVIANISKQGGGHLCNFGSCHASHQTGLDADVAFPSRKHNTDLWSLCSTGRCRAGAKISDEFDEDRFFLFVKTLVAAKNKPVIAFFIDTQIKKYMCRWARDKGENLSDPDSPAFKALQAMKHAPGHHNHVHVRFKCPGNRDCRDATVSLARTTGC
jgi:murein endopeptidase